MAQQGLPEVWAHALAMDSRLRLGHQGVLVGMLSVGGTVVQEGFRVELRTNNDATFDAATDGIRYCDVGAAFLTSRGLKRQSIDYYRQLCRLASSGEPCLRFDQKGDLYNAVLLRAIQEGEAPKGLGPPRQKDKLDTLVRQGFVEFVRGGLRFLPPDSWLDRAPAPAALSVQASDESQGRLFPTEEAEETANHLSVFTPDEESLSSPSTGSGTGSLSGSGTGCATLTGSGTASCAEHDTSYPRTHVGAHAVDVVVDVVDVVETTSKEEGGENKAAVPAAIAAAKRPVTEEEFRQAETAGYEPLLARWRRYGLDRSADKAQAHEDRWIALRAHILLQRSVITEADWEAAVCRPIENQASKRAVRKPFSQFTACLTDRVAGFWQIMPAMPPPVDLLLPPASDVRNDGEAAPRTPTPEEREADRLAIAAAAKKLGLHRPRPGAAPNGKHPQLE